MCGNVSISQAFANGISSANEMFQSFFLKFIFLFMQWISLIFEAMYPNVKKLDKKNSKSSDDLVVKIIYDLLVDIRT